MDVFHCNRADCEVRKAGSLAGACRCFGAQIRKHGDVVAFEEGYNLGIISRNLRDAMTVVRQAKPSITGEKGLAEKISSRVFVMK